MPLLFLQPLRWRPFLLGRLANAAGVSWQTLPSSSATWSAQGWVQLMLTVQSCCRKLRSRSQICHTLPSKVWSLGCCGSQSTALTSVEAKVVLLRWRWCSLRMLPILHALLFLLLLLPRLLPGLPRATASHVHVSAAGPKPVVGALVLTHEATWHRTGPEQQQGHRCPSARGVWKGEINGGG